MSSCQAPAPCISRRNLRHLAAHSRRDAVDGVVADMRKSPFVAGLALARSIYYTLSNCTLACSLAARLSVLSTGSLRCLAVMPNHPPVFRQRKEVLSIATWTPPHTPKPLATTSIRQSFARGMLKFMPQGLALWWSWLELRPHGSLRESPKRRCARLLQTRLSTWLGVQSGTLQRRSGTRDLPLEEQTGGAWFTAPGCW